MKKMFFKGYTTSGNRFQNPSKLIVGEQYLVETTIIDVVREGNGHSFNTGSEYLAVVHDLNGSLISGYERPSVFADFARPLVECRHEDDGIHKDEVHQCRDCFVKFRVKTVLEYV